MKHKIAICKIRMCGEPVLILGRCRYDDEEEFWQAYQLYTMEQYLNSPDSGWRELAQKLANKYHGKTVHFTSIDKTVTILQKQHDFKFSEAEPVEVTADEARHLMLELTNDGWQCFDDETWGK